MKVEESDYLNPHWTHVLRDDDGCIIARGGPNNLRALGMADALLFACEERLALEASDAPPEDTRWRNLARVVRKARGAK